MSATLRATSVPSRKAFVRRVIGKWLRSIAILSVPAWQEAYCGGVRVEIAESRLRRGEEARPQGSALPSQMIVMISLLFVTGIISGVAAQTQCTFITDQQPHSRPSLAKPAYHSPFADPVFGQTVVRVSGNPGDAIPNVGGTWGTCERHHYSKDQAWNADMSLLYLNYTGLFINGDTYQPTFKKGGPGGEKRWHPSNPDLMFFVGGNQIGTWNVRTDEVTVLKTFAGYSDFGISEANVSLDGNRVAIYAKNSTGKDVGFVYDMAQDKKYPDFDPLLGGWNVDWISITPLGDYVVQCSGGNTYRVFTLDGDIVAGSQLRDSIKHADMAVDADGTTQWLVGAVRDLDWGNVARYRLPAIADPASNDSRMLLPAGKGNASHVSCRNTDPKARGWCFVSSSGSSGEPYYDELDMVKLDGSEARRFAHMHAPRVEQAGHSAYRSEAHGCPSPDASKAVFASNWDESGSIGAYVVEICKDDATSEYPRVDPHTLRTRQKQNGIAATSGTLYDFRGRAVTAGRDVSSPGRKSPAGVYIVRQENEERVTVRAAVSCGGI